MGSFGAFADVQAGETPVVRGNWVRFAETGGGTLDKLDTGGALGMLGLGLFRIFWSWGGWRLGSFRVFGSWAFPPLPWGLNIGVAGLWPAFYLGFVSRIWVVGRVGEGANWVRFA